MIKYDEEKEAKELLYFDFIGKKRALTNVSNRENVKVKIKSVRKNVKLDGDGDSEEEERHEERVYKN